MNKKNYKIIGVVILIISSGCSSINKVLITTNNKGGYTIKTIKTNSKENNKALLLKGKVLDVVTHEPLANAEIRIGCNKIKTLSKGEYTFETSNHGNRLFIETIFIGYKSILTDYIDVTNKNEMQIDFYLSQDDRALINCEGK